jgi:hypothetical protein
MGLTTVNIELRRHVGQDDVVIRLQAQVEKGEEDIEARRLASAAANAVREYVQNVAPTMPMGRPTGVDGTPEVGEWWTIDELRHVKDKGKNYLKACMGPWAEFGLNIWPEVFKAAGIEDWPEAINHEGKNPGWKAYVVKREGKAYIKELLIGPKP